MSAHQDSKEYESHWYSTLSLLVLRRTATLKSSRHPCHPSPVWAHTSCTLPPAGGNAHWQPGLWTHLSQNQGEQLLRNNIRGCLLPHPTHTHFKEESCLDIHWAKASEVVQCPRFKCQRKKQSLISVWRQNRQQPVWNTALREETRHQDVTATALLAFKFLGWKSNEKNSSETQTLPFNLTGHDTRFKKKKKKKEQRAKLPNCRGHMPLRGAMQGWLLPSPSSPLYLTFS